MVSEANEFLFEVSWEVCNKVGGIYTVISSKMPAAVRSFGDNYVLLGPDLKNNLEFEETDEECWARVRELTAIRDIPCRFGRWKIPGEPKVILVNYSKKYNKDQLLFQLWEEFGVDSISGGWDYVEPVMFGMACGEVIETIMNLDARPRGVRIAAQFHEWMSAAGLLYLKKRIPEIGTIFTTHATILGRSLSGSGMDIYAEMENISPLREASTQNVAAKYSMEVAAAREADCFTTVSEITAIEAKNFLGRAPDVVTSNGLDIEHIPDLAVNRKPAQEARRKIMSAASRFLRRTLPADTKIVVISGRYEFHNKGVDVFLQALSRLEKDMTENQTVLALLFMLGGHRDLIPSLQSEYAKAESGSPPIATHRLDYEASDPILETCNRLGFRNTPQNKVNVVFMPAYLNGHDGLFNMGYYEVLSGCDLGVFPSYYEPWGYTPMESAAYAVPTVTTDQAGFGNWVQNTLGENCGVIILRRRGIKFDTINENLYGIFKNFISWEPEEMRRRSQAAREAAVRAGWDAFYQDYLLAYEKALAIADKRTTKATEFRAELRHTFTSTSSSQPHFRTFTAVVNLPKKIRRLREVAYNLWWAWNPKALEVFAHLDPKLWEGMGNNPVKMLESVSPERLVEAADNESYMILYHQVLQQFDDYMSEKGINKKLTAIDEIKWSSPVAYFSTEYGLHECIPIYSGGLGTLSGDTLKTASDLSIPLVGVGLLYRSGYFRQTIDREGLQIAEYPESDFSNMPVQIVQDDMGNEVQIALELPGRTLFANIWEIKVGRISLYLLDTDVAKNTPQDRKITNRLYPADQRTRIEQEILLGMGGVRLLKKLGIKPRVYHMNEGHSAFLVFERISTLMTEEGLLFDEAEEVVRSSSVFTTHTPVEAGNERFNRDLMEYYFSGFIKRTGISWSQFWDLGRKEIGDDKPFYMTILALKMSHVHNAVSRIHGSVARHMWRDVWKGFYDTDIPIIHVTNGVHMQTYLAPRMREILDTYLGLEWEKSISDPKRWKRVYNIPDSVLWRVRYELKQNLINYMRDNIARHGVKYSYSKTWREDILGRINPSALLVGFARRFAPYKRADLIFRDLDRLDRLVNHETRPVHFVFSGKAHPNDQMGRDLLKRVIDITKDPRFVGKIFFIEDYGIEAARYLVQGVDVWLNNPRKPLEASGTSGQKVTVNGVLNLSVSDGWWPEGYDGANGWTIGALAKDFTEEDDSSDESESLSLYSLLEDVIAPLFYDRDALGIPERWIGMIKRSMETLVPKFNTDRMLTEYYESMFLPTAKRDFEVTLDSFKLARELADWKRKVPLRFSSLRLLDVSIEGMQGDSVFVDRPFVVHVRVDPGKLDAEELLIEMVIGKRDGQLFVRTPSCIPLKVVQKDRQGILTFSGEYVVRENGPHSFGIRVMPFNKDLASKTELGLVMWG